MTQEPVLLLEDISGALKRLEVALEAHINEAHVLLQREVDEQDGLAMELIQELADGLLGPKSDSHFGVAGERDKTKGVVADIAELRAWQKMVDAKWRNGGTPAKLSSRDRSTIVVAALGSAAAVISQLISVVFAP